MDISISTMTADQLVQEALASLDRIDGIHQTLKRLNAEDEAWFDQAGNDLKALFDGADEIMSNPIYQN